jgi:hypothetical protein
VVAIDPVLIIMVAVCVRGVSQLADALAQRIILRARAELAWIAAVALPGTEVAEHDRRGGGMRIRIPMSGSVDS